MRSRNDLIAALQHDADEIIRIYLRGGSDQPSSAVYGGAAELLAHALRLVEDDGLYRNTIEARKLFLEGYVIIRRDERPRYAEAVEKLRRAIELQPEAAYAYNALGLAYLDLDRFEDAERYIREAIDRAPRWTYPRNLLGILRDERRDYGAAIRAYGVVLELDYAAYYALNNLGNTYWNLGRYQEAERLYRRSIAADSTRGLAHANLAQLYRTKGRYADAQGEAAEAMRLDCANVDRPFWIWPRLVQGWLYQELTKHDSRNEALAERAFLAAAEQAPFDPRPLSALGNVYRARGDYERAESMYRRAIANDSAYTWGWAGLGYLLHDLQRLGRTGVSDDEGYARAEQAFRAAIPRAAHPSEPLDNLGDYARWRGQNDADTERAQRWYQLADSAYRAAVTHDTLFLEAYYDLGRLNEDRGDDDRAERWYRQAERIGSAIVAPGSTQSHLSRRTGSASSSTDGRCG
ncbi:MAG: tetratricopeptide repeat protein [Longimicrobiales bacterium]